MKKTNTISKTTNNVANVRNVVGGIKITHSADLSNKTNGDTAKNDDKVKPAPDAKPPTSSQKVIYHTFNVYIISIYKIYIDI